MIKSLRADGLNIMKTPEWLSKTEAKQFVSIDIGFLIIPAFYTGDENNSEQIQDAKFRTPLYAPKIKLYGGYALTTEIEKKLSELILYYRDVLKHFESYRKDAIDSLRYFWLRPLIFKIGDFSITFPWYDTVSESERFFESISKTRQGEIFHDRDQNWELTVFAKENRLYFWVKDPDYGEDFNLLNFDRREIVAEVAQSLLRTKNIVSELSREFGKDFWTKPRIYWNSE